MCKCRVQQLAIEILRLARASTASVLVPFHHQLLLQHGHGALLNLPSALRWSVLSMPIMLIAVNGFAYYINLALIACLLFSVSPAMFCALVFSRLSLC
jgi:hypothetical protein